MNIWNSITATSIEGVLTVPSAQGRHVFVERRANFGLSFCRDTGEIVYVQNGHRYVSDRESVVLLPIEATYELYGTESGDFPLINFYCTRPPAMDSLFICPLRAVAPYLHIFDRMHRLWLESTQDNHAQLMVLFYTILSHLSQETQPENDSLSDLLAPAMEMLGHDIFNPDLTVAALAREANFSEAYFRRLFREAYGISPKQYILELRIRQAKQLLDEQTATVSAIAERCGFSGLYHFSRAFKETTGMSPTEYMHHSCGHSHVSE